MSNFRPIAMRCTQEQFDAIKPKLKGVGAISLFEEQPYLTNNYWGEKGIISNTSESNKRDYNREVYEEWNERIFLEACGIIYQQNLQDRLANLEKEIEEVRSLIEEENKPKIGDICKFWDDYKNSFTVGVLEEIVQDMPVYRFKTTETKRFKNCMKITDENFLKAFDNL